MRKQNGKIYRGPMDRKTLPIAIYYLCLPSNLSDNSEVFVTFICPTKEAKVKVFLPICLQRNMSGVLLSQVAGAGLLLGMEGI